MQSVICVFSVQIAHLNADHADPYAMEIGIRTSEKEACSSWSSHPSSTLGDYFSSNFHLWASLMFPFQQGGKLRDFFF